jgi:hypothetical protein
MQPVGKNILLYKLLTLKVPVVKGLSAASAASTKMCVTSPHNSAGIMSLMWSQIINVSPGPNYIFVQSELKLFQIDRNGYKGG